MSRDIVAIIISIICLIWIYIHAQPKPGTIDRVVDPHIKRLMQKHGTPVLICRGTVCSFERDGKVVKVSL